jgi:hypothetical protein
MKQDLFDEKEAKLVATRHKVLEPMRIDKTG